MLATTSEQPQHLILAGRSLVKTLRALEEIQAVKNRDSCTLEAVQLDVNGDSSISIMYDRIKDT